MMKLNIKLAIFLVGAISVSAVSAEHYDYHYGNFGDIFETSQFSEIAFQDIDPKYGISAPDGSMNGGGAFMFDLVSLNCESHNFIGSAGIKFFTTFWCSGHQALSLEINTCGDFKRMLCLVTSAPGWYNDTWTLDQCHSPTGTMTVKICGDSPAEGMLSGFNRIVIDTDTSLTTLTTGTSTATTTDDDCCCRCCPRCQSTSTSSFFTSTMAAP